MLLGLKTGQKYLCNSFILKLRGVPLSFYRNKSEIINNSNEKKGVESESEPSSSSSLSKTWSQKQMPKSLAMKGARFETVDISKQPYPAPAIELIAKTPIIQVHEHIVACDGGGGKLGHPKIYINLVRWKFILKQ